MAVTPTMQDTILATWAMVVIRITPTGLIPRIATR